MANFTFTDFALCRWPASMERAANTLTGKYPSGVAAHMASLNDSAVSFVAQQLLCDDRGDSVLTFSHFLPNEQSLPDWLDPQARRCTPHEQRSPRPPPQSRARPQPQGRSPKAAAPKAAAPKPRGCARLRRRRTLTATGSTTPPARRRSSSP
eukprot:994745-Prymnesium_polylepis.1